jgi:predicted glycosyltransferase
MKKPSLLFYCQHSSRGIGHLTRGLALATELGRHFNLVLLSGGKIPRFVSLPPNVEVVYLPPTERTADDKLVSGDRRRSLERTLELRRQIVMQVFERLRPAAIVVEYYPFGRLAFSSELLSLLEAARKFRPHRPLAFCSLRDITEQSRFRQTMNDLSCVLCNHLYDAVLYHADPRMSRLEDSFRPAVPLVTPVHYTGFVVPAGDEPPSAGRNGSQVIVSAGGGNLGGQLLLAAAKGYAEYGIGERVGMTITSGPYIPDEDWQALKATAAGVKGLNVCRWIPDLTSALSQARASVSQCGYNTSLAFLRARIPALVVPFIGDTDKEQMRRARKLEQLGAVRVLEPERANPQTLAAEIRALLEFQPRALELDMDGTVNTARIIKRMLQAHRRGEGV